MKNPSPKKTGIAEYKHTTRKKHHSHDISRKEWEQIQRQNLPAFRGLERDEWPIDKILDERINARDHDSLEYRVQWAEHPITKATWAPQWVRNTQEYVWVLGLTGAADTGD